MAVFLIQTAHRIRPASTTSAEIHAIVLKTLYAVLRTINQCAHATKATMVTLKFSVSSWDVNRTANAQEPILASTDNVYLHALPTVVRAVNELNAMALTTRLYANVHQVTMETHWYHVWSWDVEATMNAHPIRLALTANATIHARRQPHVRVPKYAEYIIIVPNVLVHLVQWAAFTKDADSWTMFATTTENVRRKQLVFWVYVSTHAMQRSRVG